MKAMTPADMDHVLKPLLGKFVAVSIGGHGLCVTMRGGLKKDKLGGNPGYSLTLPTGGTEFMECKFNRIWSTSVGKNNEAVIYAGGD